jgi:hypothetical protein
MAGAIALSEGQPVQSIGRESEHERRSEAGKEMNGFDLHSIGRSDAQRFSIETLNISVKHQNHRQL